MSGVELLLVAAGSALSHELLLLDEHGSLGVLALKTEQVLLNEPKGNLGLEFPHFLIRRGLFVADINHNLISCENVSLLNMELFNSGIRGSATYLSRALSRVS